MRVQRRQGRGWRRELVEVEPIEQPLGVVALDDDVVVRHGLAGLKDLDPPAVLELAVIGAWEGGRSPGRLISAREGPAASTAKGIRCAVEGATFVAEFADGCEPGRRRLVQAIKDVAGADADFGFLRQRHHPGEVVGRAGIPHFDRDNRRTRLGIAREQDALRVLDHKVRPRRRETSAASGSITRQHRGEDAGGRERPDEHVSQASIHRHPSAYRCSPAHADAHCIQPK